MNITVLICLVTAVLFMLAVLIKPSFAIKGIKLNTYIIPPVIGAVLLIAFGLVSFASIKTSFFSNSVENPLKVLALFIAMALISVYLDETGFFEYLAAFAVKEAKASQLKLLIVFYITVSVLTVFTSNDIVILTFTPFICKFAEHAKIKATPFVVAEFVAANTWSMLLVIGNPTNVYLAEAACIGFVDYFLIMALPTLIGGVFGFITLFLIYRKSLVLPIEVVEVDTITIREKAPLIVGLIHLLVCTISLAVCGYIGIEMYIVAVAFFISLFISVIIMRLIQHKKPTILLQTVKRAPVSLIPMVLGMFVIVLALNECGFSSKLSSLISNDKSLLTYGLASTLFSNILNNIPTSVLFSSLINYIESAEISQLAVYATVIGSNLGAFLTPIGALAGIMFTSILKRHGIKFSFIDFIKNCAPVCIITLIFSLAALYIVTI